MAWTRDEVLAVIHQDDVDRAPGQYFYSNTDYVALGAVVEQASGTGANAFFKQLIAGPLGRALAQGSRLRFTNEQARVEQSASGLP